MQKQKHRNRGGVLGSPSRGELLGDALRVIRSLDRPRTVTEIAEASGLTPSKVRRVIEALPDAGLALEVEKAPIEGPARPPLRYRLATWPPFPARGKEGKASGRKAK